MAKVRRRTLPVLCGLCVVLALTFWGWGALSPAAYGGATSSTVGATATSPAVLAASDGSTDTLDPVLYSRVQSLRRELSLGNRDLAAMGLTRDQAAQTLSALLGWTRRHEADLQQADGSVRGARRQLRQTMQRIHVGPRDELVIRQVPTLRDTLTRTRAARTTLINQAAAAAVASLSDGQRQIWQAARAHPAPGSAPGSAPGLARYDPDLTDAQVIQLRRDASRRVKQTGAFPYSAAASQLQAVEAPIRDRINQYLPGVIEAERAVLPEPERELDPTLTAPRADPHARSPG